jgi:hypothetical protein
MKIFSKDLFKVLGVSLSIVAISSCGNNNLIPNGNCKSDELKGGEDSQDTVENPQNKDDNAKLLKKWHRVEYFAALFSQEDPYFAESCSLVSSLKENKDDVEKLKTLIVFLRENEYAKANTKSGLLCGAIIHYISVKERETVKL